MKTSKMKTIEETFFNGRQSVEFKGIYDLNGTKLKVSIDIDSYDMQSSAIIEILNKEEKQWNFLDSIHYSQMESVKNKVFYQRKVEQLTISEKTSIRSDINRLKKSAETLLN